jgi:hypothetical protein
MKVVDDERIPTLDRGPSRQVLSEGHEDLRCPITDGEHRQKGVLLGQLLEERRQIEQRHKEERAAQKEEMATHDVKLHVCQEEVRTQSEVRSVDVEVVADFSRGVVETIRLDSGKVIRSRPMSDNERQLEIGN